MKKLFLILTLIPSLLSAANIQIPYTELASRLDPHWEQITPPDFGAWSNLAIMHRAAVPHGWLITTAYKDVTTIFVPDENHEWLK
ncbi:hypothetical protein Lnau_0358 [Legionella nautarum]|uniref:Uncharacterized protein n=1 Tax=Legionella nautarum TaxID=45070 RepID=A0A0W0X2P2_9GAMM|nr:hypothetical protein [Legionella nautarum]KTD38864.1 hypothetical protein Lnau_0358 [Legionella nautarum]